MLERVVPSHKLIEKEFVQQLYFQHPCEYIEQVLEANPLLKELNDCDKDSQIN